MPGRRRRGNLIVDRIQRAKSERARRLNSMWDILQECNSTWVLYGVPSSPYALRTSHANAKPDALSLSCGARGWWLSKWPVAQGDSACRLKGEGPGVEVEELLQTRAKLTSLEHGPLDAVQRGAHRGCHSRLSSDHLEVHHNNLRATSCGLAQMWVTRRRQAVRGLQ